MKITVLGAGTWGTALAIHLSNKGHQVTLWSAVSAEIEAYKSDRKTIKNLPGAFLPDEIVLTDVLEEAMADYELIVLAVASPFVRSTAHRIAPLVKDGSIIVNVAKGIEDGTLMTLSQVIEDEIHNAQINVLSGPTHAEEVSRGIPTTIVVGSKSKKTAHLIQDAFMSDNFRVYASPDVIGIELGGSLKNVIALAAGIVDGIGYGDNTKAALMTRGIAEISRLGVAMGGKQETFSGLSGVGDLFVTCTSHHSRNWNAGNLIGKGYTCKQATDEVKQVVEGVFCAKAAYALAKKYNISMPIVEQVNEVLFNDVNVRDAAYALFSRDKTDEWGSLSWEE